MAYGQEIPYLPLLESRLDWITVTVKPGQRQNLVKSRVANWIMEREKEGYSVLPFRTPFYEGKRIDGISWGERNDDAMVTLTGSMAAKKGSLLVSWADTVSRLDAQVTVQDGRLDRDWAHTVNDIAGQHPSVRSGETHTRLIEQRPEGVTAYIGSPGSDRMLRCYDKHAESDHEYPPGTWRFEVQWRHQRAQRGAKKLAEQRFSPWAVQAIVCEVYREYHVVLPCECPLPTWRDANIKTKTDIERQLEWVRRCVSPAVLRLIDAVGEDRVLRAMRLDYLLDDDSLSDVRSISPEQAISMMLGGEHVQ